MQVKCSGLLGVGICSKKRICNIAPSCDVFVAGQVAGTLLNISLRACNVC